uniref:Uncharacterized protein n=1 Tax=Strombidium inclinatum TaxID=197538 RepID=A0A7S3IPN0_9SPIT
MNQRKASESAGLGFFGCILSLVLSLLGGYHHDEVVGYLLRALPRGVARIQTTVMSHHPVLNRIFFVFHLDVVVLALSRRRIVGQEGSSGVPEAAHVGRLFFLELLKEIGLALVDKSDEFFNGLPLFLFFDFEAEQLLGLLLARREEVEPLR